MNKKKFLLLRIRRAINVVARLWEDIADAWETVEEKWGG